MTSMNLNQFFCAWMLHVIFIIYLLTTIRLPWINKQIKFDSTLNKKQGDQIFIGAGLFSKTSCSRDHKASEWGVFLFSVHTHAIDQLMLSVAGLKC